MEQQLRDQISALLSRDLDFDLSTIDPDKDFRDQVRLDSMQFIAIMARFEMEFGIEVPTSIMELHTFNELIDFIEKLVEEKKEIST